MQNGAKDTRRDNDDWRRWAWLTLALGLTLQVWLWSRGWIPLEPVFDADSPQAVHRCGVAKLAQHPSFLRDQVDLLGAGLEWVETGELRPVCKGMSGGGLIPGALLQILIGGPLWLWQDYRAASLLLVLEHLVAALLLLMVAREAGGQRFAALYLAVFWLSPWRLYHSGFVWEPAYMLLPAALHLWASWKLREAPAVGPSLALGALLSAAPQLHASAMVLILMTGWLILRGRIRPHRLALAGGLMMGALTLLPTLAAYLGGRLPAIVPSEKPFVSGLLNGYPLLRGLAYWLRMGSLDIGRRLRQTEFWESGEAMAVGQLSAHVATVVLAAAAMVTVGLSLVASWRYLRPRRASPANQGFLQGYACCALGATLLAIALSPVTPQGWHLLLVLPAACLPVAMLLEDGMGKNLSRTAYVLAAMVLLQVGIALVLGLGHPMYGDNHAQDCLPRGPGSSLARTG